MIDVTEHLGMARNQATKIFRRANKFKYSYEDILSMCYLSLVDSSKKFDETRGTKFSTYAYPKILFDVLKTMRDDGYYPCRRDERTNNTMESLDAPLGNCTGKVVMGLEILSNTRDPFNEILIKLAIENLSDIYKKIIFLRYFDDKTQVDIAKILKTNQCQVSRWEKKALRELREYVS